MSHEPVMTVGEIRQLTSERDGYRSAADVLGQSTKALKAERDRLVSENAALRERVEALEARGKQLDAECKSWIQTLADAETAWEEACAERDRLRAAGQALHDVLTNANENDLAVSYCILCGHDGFTADGSLEHEDDCPVTEWRAALAAHEPQGGSADG